MDEQVSLPHQPRVTTNVPRTDIDLNDVCTAVGTKWEQNPWLTLIWITQAQFSGNTAMFNTLLSGKNSAKSTRPQITRQLDVMDKTINDAIAHVKGYLLDKYGKENGDAYYAAFGIVRSDDRYIIPIDRQSRTDALKMMVAAIATEGFNDRTYGKNFWQDLATNYEILAVQSKTTDGIISTKAGSKNLLKADLKKALNAIILVLKANYPDNYKEELRSWGFQKEKY